MPQLRTSFLSRKIFFVTNAGINLKEYHMSLKAVAKPVKRTKNGEISIETIQELLWIECRRIIRARYPHVCYSCGAVGLTGWNLHTGHVVQRNYLGFKMKYDLR